MEGQHNTIKFETCKLCNRSDTKKLLIFSPSYSVGHQSGGTFLFVVVFFSSILIIPGVSKSALGCAILNPPNGHKKSRTILGRGTPWPQCLLRYRAEASLLYNQTDLVLGLPSESFDRRLVDKKRPNEI